MCNISFDHEYIESASIRKFRLSSERNSAYFSKLGDDELSDKMLKFMSDNRVDTTHVKKVSGSTIGLYLISLVNGDRTFSYWRNNSAATLLGQNINDVEHAVKKQDMIYFSGITLAIFCLLYTSPSPRD